MSSPLNQNAVTLPVTDIGNATSFYLSALRPLGYNFVSRVSHSTAAASSEAVGLGPENSSRVDLFLSQSNRTAAEKHGGKCAHIVFPAPSKAAVHDFFSNGLSAGGKPCHAPHEKTGEQGLFAATLVDEDGNKLEVCYCEPGAPVPDPEHTAKFEPCQHVDSWVRASDTMSTSSGRHQNLVPRASSIPDTSSYDGRGIPIRQQVARTTYHPVDSSRDRPSSVVSGAGSVRSSSSRRSRSNWDNGENGGSYREHRSNSSSGGGAGNAVVGTLLGAAAGAAVAYVFAKSSDDSRQKEEEFERRMKMKRDAKAEAKAHAVAMDWRDRTRSSQSRRSRDDMTAADREISSQNVERRDVPPTWKEVRKYTYPQRERSGSVDGSKAGRRSPSDRVPRRSRTTREGRRVITSGSRWPVKPSPPRPPTLGPDRRRAFSPQYRKIANVAASTATREVSRSPSRHSRRTVMQQQQQQQQQQQDTSSTTYSRRDDEKESVSRTSRSSRSRKSSPRPTTATTTTAVGSVAGKGSGSLPMYTKIKVPPSPPPSYTTTADSAHKAQDHARSILGDEEYDRRASAGEFWHDDDDDLETLVPDDSISVADGPPSSRKNGNSRAVGNSFGDTKARYDRRYYEIENDMKSSSTRTKARSGGDRGSRRSRRTIEGMVIA